MRRFVSMTALLLLAGLPLAGCAVAGAAASVAGTAGRFQNQRPWPRP